MTHILLYWNHICVLHRQEKAFLQELAGRLLTTGTADPDAARDEVLHTMACKAAIKGGWKNSREELLAVCDAVMRGEVRYCPHGRPADQEGPGEAVQAGVTSVRYGSCPGPPEPGRKVRRCLRTRTAFGPVRAGPARRACACHPLLSS